MPSGYYRHYVFKCKHVGCFKEISVRQHHVPYITGKCKKHANMHKPYEAVYGGMKRSAKERNIEFELSYDDYLKFAGRLCYYCGSGIDWQPYNEHGKNNPGWYLDRVDNAKGYSVDNCAACCTSCNRLKHDMDYELFVNRIKMIFFYHCRGKH